jgi:hypothetical protein
MVGLSREADGYRDIEHLWYRLRRGNTSMLIIGISTSWNTENCDTYSVGTSEQAFCEASFHNILHATSLD